KGARGTDPTPAIDGTLGVADAFLGAAVVVGIAGNAEGLGPLDEGFAQRVVPVEIGDGQAALAPSIERLPFADAPLHAAEVGKHVGIPPAAIALLRPGVEIHALAAIVDVPVDRTRAAEGFTARREDAAPTRPFAGLHRIEPVEARIVEGLGEAGGDVDIGVPIARARLEEQHACVPVLGQPIGEHAAGGAGADD